MEDQIRLLHGNDREWACSLLAQSFQQNSSTNYVLKGVRHPAKALQRLMHYSFDYCLHSGYCYCIPGKAVLLAKRDNFKGSIWLDLKLLTRVIATRHLPALISREKYLRQQTPKEPFLHVWYVGVAHELQGKGYGTRLMQFFGDLAVKAGLPILLETSNPGNIPFYEQLGYFCYHRSPKDVFGFPLYFYRTKNNQASKSINFSNKDS